MRMHGTLAFALTLAVAGVLYVTTRTRGASDTNADATPVATEAGAAKPTAVPAPAATAPNARAAVAADTMRWRSTLREGLAEAAKRDVLVFLYVARPRGTCLGCTLVEREVFSRPDAGKIEERAVPVRVEDTANDDPRLAEILRDTNVNWSPALFALAPNGDVLLTNFGPPIPVMTNAGSIQPGEEGDRPTLEGILARLEGAARNERIERDAMARLRTKSDSDSLVALGDLLDRRARSEEALALYRRAYEQDRWRDWGLRLARLLTRRGRTAEAADVYADLIQRNPADPRRGEWQVRKILVSSRVPDAPASPPPDLPPSFVDSVKAVLKEAQQRGEPGAEGLARLALARWADARSDGASVRDFLRWFSEHETLQRWDAATRMAVAMLATRAGEQDVGLRQLEVILSENPTSPQANFARHGFLDAVRHSGERQN
jgi:tetratricopeptide (TPR) repeat protein